MDDASEDADRVPDEVRWRVERAEGYLGLNMPGRAADELARIPPDWREARPVVSMRIACLLAAKDWPATAALAGQARARWPDVLSFWVWHAYGVRRTEDLAAARVILEEARPRFPKAAIVLYNLACYECQLGRPDAALELLARATALDPAYLDLALEDDDLAPVRPQLEA